MTEPTDQPLSLDLPKYYPSLHLSGVFRSVPEDFKVDENLGFTPAGEGEHQLLHIEKTGQNTHWVAQQIADFFGLDKKAVGYCGRTDRHAVTRHWMSIYDPKQHCAQILSSAGLDTGASQQAAAMAIEGVTLLSAARHLRKLRPGDHQSNRFSIRLRDLVDTRGHQALDPSQHASIISDIQARLQQGVPNYFGLQRFGRDGNNLRLADAWLNKGKPLPSQQRGIVISAARAYLFNQILAQRLLRYQHLQPLDGDIVIDGIPTAALWGRGRLASTADVLQLETATMERWHTWCHGLEHCGLQQERRPITLLPKQCSLAIEDNDFTLRFELPAGAFATSVLAEIIELREAPVC